MIKKYKIIVAVFLMVVFLMPNIIKLEHHHDTFVCKAKAEKHFHDHHKKCAVCAYEFSIFSNDFVPIVLSLEQTSFPYFNWYPSLHFLRITDYSFLLRAPPLDEI
ncbi:MAG: hypothetical protein ACERKD_04485 [Prolixibacteraceae bacterium]